MVAGVAAPRLGRASKVDCFWIVSVSGFATWLLSSNIGRDTTFKGEHEEVTAMEVLVTGGDTELGRAIAEGFRDAGHRVVMTGARRDELEVAAKELDLDALVVDNTAPVALAQVRAEFPRHLDTIVNVPAPRWTDVDLRAFTP